MATILAHIKVKPGTEAVFEKAAQELYEGTHGHEKNVNRYEYWRGREPGSYYTLLAFPDYVGFLVHQSSDHHEEAGKSLGQAIESIDLEWLDPIQGASPLPPTDTQQLPPDATELMRQYSQSIQPQVQEWWRAQR